MLILGPDNNNPPVEECLIQEVVVVLLEAVDVLLVDLGHGLDQWVALDDVNQVAYSPLNL